MNKKDIKLANEALPAIAIDGGGIDLWFVRLQGDDHVTNAAAATLSDPEMRRADQFRFSMHRNRFILAHAALRGILGSYSGCPASSIDFTISPHGKPSLADRNRGEIEFNLSHSEDLAVVAVSHGSIMGVDVEQVREMPDWPQMAQQFFSEAEIAAIERVSLGEKSTMFLRFWTRKEALLKAIGIGLQDDLASFCTVADDLDQESVVRVPEMQELPSDDEYMRECTLSSFEFEGFVGALAVCGPVSSVRRVQWVW